VLGVLDVEVGDQLDELQVGQGGGVEGARDGLLVGLGSRAALLESLRRVVCGKSR